jgi:hypothetical protein
LNDRFTIHANETSRNGPYHIIEKGREVGLGGNTALEEAHTKAALKKKQDVVVDVPIHAALIWNKTKDTTPENESLLQQIAFDELVQLLKVSTPQGFKHKKLETYTWNLLTPETRHRMQKALDNTVLKESYEAVLLWHKIHAELQRFQTTTHYNGKAGAEWQSHKQVLRVSSWKEGSLPAVAAHRELGLFVQQCERRGEWVASRSDEFARRVACFYATLLQAPNVCTEDLVGGFYEYNVELLMWFRV